MFIKNEIFELEISEEIGIYFGSKASGQHFKKWEDFKEEEKKTDRNDSTYRRESTEDVRKNISDRLEQMG